MAKSIHERVRDAIAKREREAAQAEYKAGESARRSRAAKVAAEVRSENRLDRVLRHEIDPTNRREREALDRQDYGIGEDF
jgi:hypothetical protein